MMQRKSGDAKGATDEALRDKARREQSYRERALKLFPWVCGRCGREFSGKKLQELTVHHKDHNHDNNPPDGSNWELLCIYCHDNIHSRGLEAEHVVAGEQHEPTIVPTHQPFADLAARLKPRK
ncbi:MAG: YajD family HNH nuclease [Thermodesulfobacteriota bacterium]|jgi:predicted HNH restriction endonuclease